MAEDVRGIDIKVAPIGNSCEVKVNGESVQCYKFVITAEVGHITEIELHCWLNHNEPYIIRGRMLVEAGVTNG